MGEKKKVKEGMERRRKTRDTFNVAHNNRQEENGGNNKTILEPDNLLPLCLRRKVVHLF